MNNDKDGVWEDVVAAYFHYPTIRWKGLSKSSKISV
jgi:hypothetical protein